MSESSTSMGCIVVDSLDGPAGLSVGTIEKICSTVLCSHLSADYTEGLVGPSSLGRSTRSLGVSAHLPLVRPSSRTL